VISVLATELQAKTVLTNVRVLIPAHPLHHHGSTTTAVIIATVVATHPLLAKVTLAAAVRAAVHATTTTKTNPLQNQILAVLLADIATTMPRDQRLSSHLPMQPTQRKKLNPR